MQIFDMHIHARNTQADPEQLLKEMEAAGVYGGCIFSNRPLEENPKTGSDFETRLKEISDWTKDYPDRLFPVLWVHPDEEGIDEKIQIAVDNNVAAFKVICNNFFVYEDKSMKMLSRIAESGKPVFFHSGILWDGIPSSSYNRPMNWEALLEIPNIRFSMGHCSWPWHDECIALYGKFLNALSRGKTAEMFFDLTPGTPELYREELFRKLFTIGYDVPNNILYGVDCKANGYNSEWAKRWLKIDTALFDKFNISEKTRNKIYKDNLFRFLGKTERQAEHLQPLHDDQIIWSPEMDR